MQDMDVIVADIVATSKKFDAEKNWLTEKNKQVMEYIIVSILPGIFCQKCHSNELPDLNLLVIEHFVLLDMKAIGEPLWEQKINNTPAVILSSITSQN